MHLICEDKSTHSENVAEKSGNLSSLLISEQTPKSPYDHHEVKSLKSKGHENNQEKPKGSVNHLMSGATLSELKKDDLNKGLKCINTYVDKFEQENKEVSEFLLHSNIKKIPYY